MNYRPDIDGLRAIAVIAVVLFHANPEWCPGGFVGVDVFFVISGFLITTIIQREIQRGDFSILKFYKKRILRILPALTVMMLVTLIGGWFILQPPFFEDLGVTMVSAALSFSNFKFWMEAGYFDTASELKPLLHTWSLSVEEQFYVVLPCLLLILHRFLKRHTLTLLALLSVASLAICIWQTKENAATAFFLLHTRAWELLAGSLLAFWSLNKTRSLPNWINHGSGLVGLALIVHALTEYTKDTSFPGSNAVVPCLGAVLLIAGNGGIVAKVLSLGPLVFVGKISYSLYLWHWPVFVYLHHLKMGEITAFDRITATVGSVILSVISWKYVEQPFRNQNFNHRFTQRTILLGGACAVALLSSLGWILKSNGGFPVRLPKETTQILSASQPASVPRRVPAEIEDPIRLGAEVKPSIAVWGDSHVRVISEMLGNLAGEHGKAVDIHYYAGTAPILDLKREVYSKDHGLCSLDAFNRICNDDRIETVILHARWAVYFGAPIPYAPLKMLEPMIPDQEIEKTESQVHNARMFRKTVEGLLEANKHIVLVYPVPEVGIEVPTHLANLVWRRQPYEDFTRPADLFYLRQRFSFEELDSLGDHPNITRVYPHRFFEHEGRMITSAEGKVLYRDDNHLSVYGSDYIKELFEEICEGG